MRTWPNGAGAWLPPMSRRFDSCRPLQVSSAPGAASSIGQSTGLLTRVVGVRVPGGVRRRTRAWRNRQPHQPQTLASESSWRFDCRRPHSMGYGGTGRPAWPWTRSFPGSKPGIPAHAFVAHQAERRPRKTQAAGSRPAEGSHVLVVDGPEISVPQPSRLDVSEVFTVALDLAKVQSGFDPRRSLHALVA